MLLSRRVAARRLLPTAFIGAGALGVLTAVAPLFVSHLASTSADHYGLVGFAFAFLTWLFAQAVIIAAAAVIGAAIGDRPRLTAPGLSRASTTPDPAPARPTIASPSR